jgi:hypothetical protein
MRAALELCLKSACHHDLHDQRPYASRALVERTGEPVQADIPRMTRELMAPRPPRAPAAAGAILWSATPRAYRRTSPEGLVSAAAARKLYGVVLRRDRSLDERATNELRERLRSAHAASTKRSARPRTASKKPDEDARAQAGNTLA